MSSQAALKFLEKYGMSPENVSPARDAVRMAENIIRIDMLAVQVSDHILSGSVVIDHADKRRTQPHIRDILRDIAADAPVRLDHTSDVTAAGDEFIIRVALDIHENSTEYDNAHGVSPLSDLTAVPLRWSLSVLYDSCHLIPEYSSFFP